MPICLEAANDPSGCTCATLARIAAGRSSASACTFDAPELRLLDSNFPASMQGPRVRSYTRRQLKQDQVTAAFTERVHWAVEHRQKLIWGAVVVATALAVGLTVWGYTHYRQSRATEALAQAMQTYKAPIRAAGEQPAPGTQSFASASERSKAAHAEFARVSDQYSSTRSGRLARYFSGVTAVELNDNAAAERDLKKAAETSDPDLSALAKLALAN